MASSQVDAFDQGCDLGCRDVLDAIADAMLVLDGTGRIVYANERATLLFGCERQELEGRNLGDHGDGLPPSSPEETAARVHLALEEGTCGFPWHGRRKDGDLFWADVTLRRHDTDGRVWLFATVREHERGRRTGDAARLDDEELSTVFQASSHAMALAEQETGELVDVNRAWTRTSGVDRDVARGRTLLELGLFCDPADHEAFRAELERTGRVRPHEAVLAMRSGPRLTQVTAEVIASAGGAHVLWELADLSELRRSEQALRETQQLAGLGSWTLDLKTERMDWSEEVYRIFELDPSTFQPSLESFLSAVHPDDREQVDRVYAESVENRTPYSLEHRLRMADGRIKFVQERGVTYYDDRGRPIRCLGTVQDVTKDKQAAAERASLETQLQHAQRMESVGRLAGGVAHDFNNMLGVILGQLELSFADLPPAHPVRANLQGIQEAAERCKELTAQLLAFARKQTIAPRVLDINAAVAATLSMLRRVIGEHIGLSWNPSPDAWPVKLDPAQLDQILVNLCVNSRDAIADVGTITIETANVTFDEDDCATHLEFAPGDYVRLTVSDDGCGMDRETVGHIFEPFFTTKPAGVGTGLGLAMIYGVVRQNNGFIKVYSEPGRGTSFTIFLRRHGDGTAEPLPDRAAPARLDGSETILLVEDDPSLLPIFAVTLGKRGYTVLPAGTPAEALRLAAGHAREIRLLVSDVVMPDMNGRELATRVDALIPGVRRLFMSGYTADVIAHHDVLEAGVSFIQKPFTATELAAKVREVLDGEPAGALPPAPGGP